MDDKMKDVEVDIGMRDDVADREDVELEDSALG